MSEAEMCYTNTNCANWRHQLAITTISSFSSSHRHNDCTPDSYMCLAGLCAFSHFKPVILQVIFLIKKWFNIVSLFCSVFVFVLHNAQPHRHTHTRSHTNWHYNTEAPGPYVRSCSASVHFHYSKSWKKNQRKKSEEKHEARSPACSMRASTKSIVIIHTHTHTQIVPNFSQTIETMNKRWVYWIIRWD